MATYIQDYLYTELPENLAAFDLPTEEGIYILVVDSEGNIKIYGAKDSEGHIIIPVLGE